MRYTPLEEKIIQIATPVINDLGFSFHHIKINGEDGSSIVQIMAEDPKTKNLLVDNAAKISRALSAVMDVEDPINGAYRLEISSPGIDRLLIKENDFEDYNGHEIKLELSMPNNDGQKRFRGSIKSLENHIICLITDRGDVQIAYNDIEQAKLVLTDKLIKATANF